MALPTIPKKELRSVAVSIRLTKKGAEAPFNLAKTHNMSQGEVVEHLVFEEIKATHSKKSK